MPRALCQGAPGAVVPRCPGLRTAPSLPPPAWLSAEMCRCAGPWEVRNARSLPKPRCGKDLPGSPLAPVLGWRLWMSLGLVLALCHPCAGSVALWQCSGRQGAPKALLRSAPRLAQLLAPWGSPAWGALGEAPAAQRAAHEQFQLQSHAQSLSTRCSAWLMGAAVLPRAWRRPTTPLLRKNGARDGSGASSLVWKGRFGQG